MSEGNKRPEIRGNVLEVRPEWRNNTGTFWKQEVVVETGFRFPNPLKVTFQKDSTSLLADVNPGDAVIIPYALNGRKWDGPNGPQYYVDIVGLGLTKIVAGSSAAKAEQPQKVMGCNAAQAIETWTAKHGDDKAGFAAFCKNMKPGKSSKDYTIADWADIVNAINEASQPQPEAPAADPEDLPF